MFSTRVHGIISAHELLFPAILIVGLVFFVPMSVVQGQTCSGGSGGSGGPTLRTISINGDATDWAAVLANPLQITDDGQFSPQCDIAPTDRDCRVPNSLTGRDLHRFSWTYDGTNIYVYLTRYGSTSNTNTFYFYMDLDSNQRMNTGDKVFQVLYSGSNRKTDAYVFNYLPIDTTNGDPMASGGYADGYTIIGHLDKNSKVTIYTQVIAGWADGIGFEASVPWSVLGVPAGRGIYYHVSSSNSSNSDQVPASIDDNLGGPGGGLGTFGYYLVSVTPSYSTSTVPGSPTVVDYNHTITNTGTLPDRFNLDAFSSLGFQVDLYRTSDMAWIATDLTGDGVWNTVNATFDGDSDGRPDTGVLAPAGTFAVTMRLSAPSGTANVVDTTLLEAISKNASDCMSDWATDTTAIGQLLLLPSPQTKTGVPGQVVNYGLTLTNYSLSDVFEFRIPNTLGWQVNIYTDPNSDGDPSDGVLIATDANGNGAFTDAGDSITAGYDTNGNNLPDFGTTGNGSTQKLVIQIAIPPGTSTGTQDVATAYANGATHGDGTVAVLTSTAYPRLYLYPSYSSSSTPPTNKFSGENRSVFYSHTLMNSWPAADNVTLTGVSSHSYTVRFYTDPDGDGNPSDGTLITGPVSLAANGGTLHFVCEVVLPIIPTTSFPLTDTTTLTATSGLNPAVQVSVSDQVRVSYVSVWGDASHALSRTFFARCDTVYAMASSLSPSTTSEYQLRYYDPSMQLVRTQTIPTTADGDGYDQYTFTFSDPVGTWTVRLYDSSTLIDTVTLILEPATTPPTVNPVATDQASYATVGDNLAITAIFNNPSSGADFNNTSYNFRVLNAAGTTYLQSDGTFASYTGSQWTRTTSPHNVPWGQSDTETVAINSVTFPSSGTYQLQVSWIGPCSNVIATNSMYFPVGTTLASFADAGGTQPRENFGTNQTVYLLGSYYVGSTGYKIAYYRPNGSLMTGVSVTSTAGGTISTNRPVSGFDADGTWHAVIYNNSVTPPATYNAADPLTVSADSFIIDTSAPAAPIISSITTDTGASASDAITQDRTLYFNGTAEPNSTVNVYIGGVYIGSTTANASGDWTLDYTGTSLADATNNLTATATDAAGNTSGLSSVFPVVVDNAPPAPPTVISPADGSVVTSHTPSVSGTAEPNSSVNVYVDGILVGTVSANGAGAWNYTLTAGQTLNDGPHTVYGDSTDAAGNTSANSSTNNFSVKYTPPTVSSPIHAGDSTIIGTSTSPAGTTITVFKDGVSIGTATVQAGGTWSLTGISGLIGGESITATAGTGTAMSDPSAAVIVIPYPPIVASPLLAGTTIISGTSLEPVGSQVTVYVDGVLAGNTTVQAGGTWDLTGVAPLADGQYVTATSTVDGETSAPSPRIYVGNNAADITPPPAVNSPVFAGATSISGNNSASPAGTLIDVYVDAVYIGQTTVQADGTWTLTGIGPLTDGQAIVATATDLANNHGTSMPSPPVYVSANAGNVTPAPAISEPVLEGATTVSGTSTASPGSIIDVFVNGIYAGSTSVQAGGTWTLTGIGPLSAGGSISATATDVAAGTGTSALASAVIVDFAAPVVDSPIYAGTSSISGTSVSPAGTTITVYKDGTAIGTTTVQAGGTWTLTGVSGLIGGESITARAGAGGPSESAVSNTVIVTPAAPTIDAPMVAGATSITGTSSAPAGSTITAYVGSTPYTGTVQTDGTWSVAVPPLAGGESVTATVTTNGQISSSAGPVVVHYAAPVVDSPIYQGATSVSGTSSSAAGTTITVYQNGTSIGTTTVQADGTWTLSGVTGLAGGDNITATAGTGAAQSGTSNTVTVLAIQSLPPIVTSPVYAGTNVTVYGSSVEAAGSLIKVYLNGLLLGSTTVQAGGTWTLTAISLNQNDVLSATVQASGKSVSPLSNEVLVAADSSSVTPAPVVTAPIPGLSTSVSGTSVAGAEVAVFAEGVYLGTTAVDAFGNWTLSGLDPLPPGTTVSAVATLPPGGTSPWSHPVIVGNVVDLLRSDLMSSISQPIDPNFRWMHPDNPSMDPLGANHVTNWGEGVLQEGNGSSDDDKAYIRGLNEGDIDPDPTVLTDENRPLVFYQLIDNNSNNLRLTKQDIGGGEIRIQFHITAR